MVSLGTTAQRSENMNLDEEMAIYAKKNGYPIELIEKQTCDCGSDLFTLFSDDLEGGAYIVCSKCKKERDIRDSRMYIENKEQNICNCDEESLQISIGVAFFKGTRDPRWIYVGARCPKCELAGAYVDWKEN